MAVKLFNNPLLERALNASWLRNEAISENIANVDTPGYKRKDVNFQDYLNAAMKKDGLTGVATNAKHIPIGNDDDDSNDGDSSGPQMVQDYSDTTMRMDGNNVDIDTEMAELAKNQILYNAYASLLNKNYVMIRSAIKEGR